MVHTPVPQDTKPKSRYPGFERKGRETGLSIDFLTKAGQQEK
jgi:hypothetical protein